MQIQNITTLMAGLYLFKLIYLHFITVHHSYHLHTKFYPIFFC